MKKTYISDIEDLNRYMRAIGRSVGASLCVCTTKDKCDEGIAISVSEDENGTKILLIEDPRSCRTDDLGTISELEEEL